MEESEVINTSNSKNEYVVECEPDSQTVLFAAKTAVEETSKLYGPIFTRMVSEYALKFEARMLKEKPPENIQGLDAVTNYITANLNRYPRGYNALIYGIARADSKLQGSTGSGSRRAAYSGMKSVLEGSGLLNGVIGTTEDIFEANCKSLEIFKAIKTAVTSRHIRGKNNQVIVAVPNCAYKDACEALLNEGISRLVGGMECIYLILTIFGPEIITKKHLDYKLEELDKPECKGRMFEV
ncbi:MAG: hypothetical protein WED07_03105 [Candidatus Freyarchaeum deiterrae]